MWTGPEYGDEDNMCSIMDLVEGQMIERLLIAVVLVLPGTVMSDEMGKGEDIFNARCAMCHSLSRTMKMIGGIAREDRPAYLKKFLRSHPNKLKDADEDLVIMVLSTPGQ